MIWSFLWADTYSTVRLCKLFRKRVCYSKLLLGQLTQYTLDLLSRWEGKLLQLSPCCSCLLGCWRNVKSKFLSWHCLNSDKFIANSVKPVMSQIQCMHYLTSKQLPKSILKVLHNLLGVLLYLMLSLHVIVTSEFGGQNIALDRIINQFQL